MNVLIIGSGGREHALTWKVLQSPLVDKVYCAPGNPGMARLGECVDLDPMNFEGLATFAKEKNVELCIVGPENPLASGIVDFFQAEGLRVFGPRAAAARLEASKSFAKGIMEKYSIPTSAYQSFTDADAAKEYVREQGAPIVVKADGLAAGKGVTVAHDVETALAAVEEAMVGGAFGDAGSSVVIEEFLVGEEASIFALTDGESILTLATSQDHKPLLDGDEGPNTGGMGAYSPAPVVTLELEEVILNQVLLPCIRGMAAEGARYTGVLYAGLMIGPDGPKVVEFNCRFGDPETQVVLPRMDTDLVPLLIAACDGELAGKQCAWKEGACVTVVMASGGYPKAYEKGKLITGIDAAEEEEGVVVFHAGTGVTDEGLVTKGGRVLNVTATDTTISRAIDKAYHAVRRISFEKAHFRGDIGQKALNRIGS